MPTSEDRPVLTGLAALIGVGLVVGLVLGGAALAGTKVLGIGGDDDGGTATSGASMYLPEPSPTDPPTGPLITLATDPDAEDEEESEPESEESTPEKELALTTAQTEVSPMGRIDLSGTYVGGEGAVLQVERFVDGAWAEFQVTAVVSQEKFSTYVQTGRTGVNKFRMRDTGTGELSNEVTVQIG